MQVNTVYGSNAKANRSYTVKSASKDVEIKAAAWIRSPSFDLSFVFGGALFTLAVAFLGILQPRLLPLFFWIWIVGFEGSHFWATISRTYLDAKFRAENSAVLWGSLIFFLLPVLALAFDKTGSGASLANIYGFAIFVWSLYHNARQHFGFLSIYSKKSGLSTDEKNGYVKALYTGVGAAQIYFMLNFKALLAFGLGASTTWTPDVAFVLGVVPKFISFFAFVWLIRLALRDWQREGGLVPALYVATCLVFYSTMFYVIAPLDLFVQSGSGTQTLILIAIMNSLFHNIQYHAIVWHYGQVRYNKTMANGYGVAKWVNSKTPNYAGVALALGLGFAFIVWNLASWPWIDGVFPNSTQQNWAYALFFGIIGHHFYLDQKIWRPSQQTDLKSYLNI